MKGLETLERFRIDVTDHVATLTITAPPVNSQDRKFREEIIRIFDVLGAEPSMVLRSAPVACSPSSPTSSSSPRKPTCP